jgi:nitroreductase
MIEGILARRSIRSGFEPRTVPSQLVERIVSCALVAPSSKNAQPWRIHAVSSPALLAEFANAVAHAKGAESYVPLDPATGRSHGWRSTVVESAELLRQVPLGLFVENTGRFSRGRRTVAATSGSVLESALQAYGFELMGLGAAVQNMWLAAEASGLRGVFMGDVVIAEEAIGKRLRFDGDLVGVLALGYTSGEPTPKQLLSNRVVLHP